MKNHQLQVADLIGHNAEVTLAAQASADIHKRLNLETYVTWATNPMSRFVVYDLKNDTKVIKYDLEEAINAYNAIG